MAATDALPIPRKNAAYRLYFEFRDNTGALVSGGVTGADTERSIDGAAFADCTNEFTEIGTSGCGYIDLTSSEMNGDAIYIKSTCTNTNARPFTIVLLPQESGDIQVHLQSGATDAISAAMVSAAAANKVRDAVTDDVVEAQGGITLQQAVSVMLAALAGRTSGGQFSTPNNGAVRAAFTYSGNDRTAVTLTPSS